MKKVGESRHATLSSKYYTIAPSLITELIFSPATLSDKKGGGCWTAQFQIWTQQKYNNHLKPDSMDTSQDLEARNIYLLGVHTLNI